MLNKFFLITILMVSGILRPNMAPKGFERFLNYYFVETGTYLGNGIKLALRAQFPEIYSIEINQEFARDAQRKFKRYSNVHIRQGDSGRILWDVIKDLKSPITFWLDGHVGDITVPGKQTPILEELEQIRKHPIKFHTILIDDMHCCGTAFFDFITKEDIITKIMKINPRYQISYVDGGDAGEYENNIMVARIPGVIEL
jgi:hypothetical protein